MTIEQNKKINELKREVIRINERLRALELDVEPDGHISASFDAFTRDLEEFQSQTNRRFDTLSHQVNLVLARQQVMLEAFTKITDLQGE